jgi:hypothetical protein
MGSFFILTQRKALPKGIRAARREIKVVCMKSKAVRMKSKALSPSLYELFYVHRKRVASIDIDTTFPKRLHGFNLFFTIQTAAISKKGGIHV